MLEHYLGWVVISLENWEVNNKNIVYSKRKNMPDFDQTVESLMHKFPNLDRMICETLLKTPPDKLRNYIDLPEKRKPEVEEDDLLLKSVEIT